ncbi:hypothetical protein MOJ76_15620 [Bacillus haynesii]|uniref:hypothetical protein n=1 Tax=Bacillus haynesii TaxID=1925021 RepID=UPI002282D224|nr:hypothetical protein [Bacillus haynesii]MCY8009722.1 hypothetical protein [Bacillus haynesii]
MTIDELADKYELHPDYVRTIIERTDGLAVKGNVAYVPKQSYLMPALGVAALFFAIVIMPKLIGG